MKMTRIPTATPTFHNAKSGATSFVNNSKRNGSTWTTKQREHRTDGSPDELRQFGHRRFGGLQEIRGLRESH
jgi:hypothetical protein